VSIIVRENKTIRGVICSLLICIFALGITPRILLHDLVADHDDISFQCNNEPGTHFHKSGYNCHIENFAAESPFTDVSRDLSVIPPNYCTVLKSVICNQIFPEPVVYFELRGPPFTA
jgi:hypothetical protein